MVNPNKAQNFRAYNSEEEIAKKKKKTWTISVRVNAEEKAFIKELQKMLNINMEGTALKIGARVGYNVLHGTFTPKLLQYITSETRKRELID